MHRWDVNFSLAIYNRTGKYFIGRDIIASQRAVIRKVFYWRLALGGPPTGLGQKLVGKTEDIEFRLRARGPGGLIPKLRTSLPMLHLDPLTAMSSAIGPRDMVLCHDLGPITHRDLFDPATHAMYDRAYADIAQRRPRMVFVSKASQDDYERLYGPAHDARVIYPPIRRDVADMAADQPKGVAGRFILCVGAMGRRKNQAALIEAYERAKLHATGVQLVLCGAKEPGSDDVARRAQATPGVILLDYVSDAELAWLYAHAQGFALVSRLEGFGMPVAEAINRGLTPLVSKDSVLQEVTGPSALVADPGDVAEIADGLARMAAMAPEERENRVSAAQAWGARFSIEEFERSWGEALGA